MMEGSGEQPKPPKGRIIKEGNVTTIIPGSTRVICIDCKWQYKTVADLDARCMYPPYQEKFHERSFVHAPKCTDKNSDGKCQAYHRKWWKFWRPKEYA